MQLVKKISVGGINETRGGFRDVKETFLAARIMGIATAVEAKETNLGKSLRFSGEFRAINQHGEEFAGPVLYLVEPADDMLAAAIATSNGAPVTFGFDVFVAPKEKRDPRDLGYAYQVKPLLETKASDPLQALMQTVNSSAPAIAVKPKQAALTLAGGTEAPAAETAPAPAAETAQAPAPAAEPEQPARRASDKKK